MSRQGIVAVIDLEQSAAAIRTGAGEYTIVEIDPDWAMDLGDTIEWENDENLGFETYRNTTKEIYYEVFVQNHNVDDATLRLQFPGSLG